MEEETTRRKNKGPNFRVYVGTSLPHAAFCEIERVVKDCNLTKAEVLRALCLRGLNAYQNDGLLTEQKQAGMIKAQRGLAVVANDQSAEAA